MPITNNKKTRPFCLRLTAEERLQLEEQAGGKALGSYVRARLFETGNAPAQRNRIAACDRKALAQALGRLGEFGLSVSLTDLCELARSGVLPVSAETEAALNTAYREILDMKAQLMKALGIQER